MVLDRRGPLNTIPVIHLFSSCPGLSRASTSSLHLDKEDVDGRDKPGHDSIRSSESERIGARWPFTWMQWPCFPCSRPGRGGSLPPSGGPSPSAWSFRIRPLRG